MIRAGIGLAIALAVWCGLLFGAAGDPYWTRGWFHVGLGLLTLAANAVILRLKNPDLLGARAKRLQIGSTFEKVTLPLLVLSSLAIPAVAGFDAARYRWAVLPLWLMGPGVLIHVAGDALMLSAMAANPFAIGDIRIQTERGHHVVTTGPYAIVRHPMYTGLILALAAVPLIVGSGWAVLPTATVALIFVTRTAYEDRMLHAELPGYAQYAEQTRYRLIPGIW